MTLSPAYVVTAHNTATQSDNKIHDDAVAAAYGFSGGLVPGVDVYAYLTHVPAERWGLGWLSGGTITARFVQPVYDRDDVSVVVTEGGPDTRLELQLLDSGGKLCATGVATIDHETVDPSAEDAVIPRADQPGERPPASPEVLAPGTVLGAVGADFDVDRADDYLDDVRETLPLYREEGVAHPGWLLRFANSILVANVGLGPWIHVGSDVRLLGHVRQGDQVEGRARVVEEYERKGHRFVVLDVALGAAGRPVQRVRHTAIYQPRRP